jgi:dTDP-4-dehydrorhamnose 3,5-epimerase
MRWSSTRIAGVIEFTPSPHVDDRGFFSRTFDAGTVGASGIDPTGFRQDSVSRTRRGVVRGLHVRTDGGEAKLVRCSYGAVYDIAVDLRPWSPTFGSWEAFELSDSTQSSVYLPAGIAHGLQALSDVADVAYRIDRDHDPQYDAHLAHDDPELQIPWPLPVTGMSDRDRSAPPLSVLRPWVTEWFPDRRGGPRRSVTIGGRREHDEGPAGYSGGGAAGAGERRSC